MLSLNAFTDGWNIGYVFFGLHLALLGYLVFTSGYIPKILGILLVVSGWGWLIDRLAIFLFPDYNANIGTYTGIFEAVFMFWLLLKGREIPEIESTQYLTKN